MFDRVAIIGIGLLGGSLARAMKEKSLCNTVTACGRSRERLDYALNHGIADLTTTDPAEAARGADLIVISTPVGSIPDMFERIRPELKIGAIITDVGSTKESVVEAAERILPSGAHFIGSHPMAGSEKTGVEASRANLFDNALCVVTPSALTEVAPLEAIQSLWKTLNCRVMLMSPREHDYLVAASSHLPHLVAAGLCRAVSNVSSCDEKVLPLLAGGFRDTTRVASGSPELWRDIILANSQHIAGILDGFISSMKEIRDIATSSDPSAITDMFTAAKTFRDELPARGLGALVSDYQLIVEVENTPGVLGKITTALGDASINIKNIIIQNVREQESGALLLILEKEDDLDRATAILAGLGFPSHRK